MSVGMNAAATLDPAPPRRLDPNRARRRRLLLMTRTLSWLANAIERRTQGDNFVVSDLTPYDVVYREDLLAVRHYRQPEGGKARFRVPVIMVPPLAASTAIFDLMPNRSLVRYFLARGFEVYLVDWGDPQNNHNGLGLSDYVMRMLPAALAAVRRASGVEDISILGYCLGGLFGLMYAGWADDPNLKNLVTIASPIDLRRAGLASQLVRLIDAPARLVRRYTHFRLHDLDPKWLQVPGWFTALAFKLTNPLGTVQAYWDLLLNLWDRDYVTRYQTTAAWLNRMHAYPGALVQDLFVSALVDNDFARGVVPLNDCARAGLLAHHLLVPGGGGRGPTTSCRSTWPAASSDCWAARTRPSSPRRGGMPESSAAARQRRLPGGRRRSFSLPAPGRARSELVDDLERAEGLVVVGRPRGVAGDVGTASVAAGLVVAHFADQFGAGDG